MQTAPSVAILGDGKRLHLQHGPIDLIVEAFGSDAEIRYAFDQARSTFEPVLTELVEELVLLRQPVGREPEGIVARTMWAVTNPYAPEFITPMAAVAGSVADHILHAMTKGVELDRAYVNNGGDIALCVNEGSFKIGICDDPVTGIAGGLVEIGPGDGIGGIATSGWRGRSFSLGIADAVTVLAPSAAMADAGATMIANRVDLPGSRKVSRERATSLQPDSDLGELLVTTGVAGLDDDEIAGALARGQAVAVSYLERSLFKAAYLSLAGTRLTVPDTLIRNNKLERTTHG